MLGDQKQDLTPQQATDRDIKLASPVDTGAPARVPLAQFARNNGVSLPGQATNPTRSGQAAQTPASAGPGPAAGPSLNFGDAPQRPSFLTNANQPLTDYQKQVSGDYQEAETGLRDEANQLKSTQAELVKNQRMQALLPNAKTGPGTDTMAAIQTSLGNMTGSQFSSWLNSNPSAYALLSKQLGQSALDDRLKEMTSSGAQVKLGAQQDNLILNKLSASPEMPKTAIASLLNWQAQQLQYDVARQRAIPSYIAQGKDAREFDSYYSARNPLQNSLTTAAPKGTTLPKADSGGFIPGKVYRDKVTGKTATYQGNGSWQ